MLLLRQIKDLKFVLLQKVKNMRGLYFSSIEHVAFLYPCKCVHTLFFLRAIDVAFVNKKNKVIEVVDNLSP